MDQIVSWKWEIFVPWFVQNCFISISPHPCSLPQRIHEDPLLFWGLMRKASQNISEYLGRVNNPMTGSLDLVGIPIKTRRVIEILCGYNIFITGPCMLVWCPPMKTGFCAKMSDHPLNAGGKWPLPIEDDNWIRLKYITELWERGSFQSRQTNPLNPNCICTFQWVADTDPSNTDLERSNLRQPYKGTDGW